MHHFLPDEKEIMQKRAEESKRLEKFMLDNLESWNEEEKNWKSDVFCCSTMETLIKNEDITIDGLSGKTLRLHIGLWNGYFRKEECAMGWTGLKYCVNCGKQVTEEFIRKLIEKFGLEYPKYYLEKHPELDHKLQIDKDKKLHDS
ncbi:MAG: hypothetical protein L0H53_00590 [Candidatus Nitrosocosmicus sp.]|nr:hypothetical protein [Candidatus Nitrosocosmicus sp.]MDN5866034.1 hypothetical protein [Candidatus Nitrosocosmicus sp.]